MSQVVNAVPTSTVTLTIRLGAFGWTELDRRAAREGTSVPEVLERAAGHFEGQLGSGLASVRVPDFSDAAPGTPRQLTLELPQSTWRALSREAKRQCVSLECLLAHVALFFLQ